MRFKSVWLRLLIVLAVCVAGFLLYRSFSRFSVEDVSQSIRAIPGASLLRALAFAGASYLCLTGFDALAVRYVRKPLAYRRTALASFCGLSIGHNVGIAALSSGAVRYRFYARWGLSAEEIAKVIIFCGVTVALGLATLAGLGLLAQPGNAATQLGLARPAVVAMAILCLAVPVAYLAIAIFLRGSVHLWSWTVEPPDWRIALGQIGVGTLNFACVAACLHQLMAAVTDVGYLKVATAYVTANLAALVSHVPGGLGVLEATVLYVLPGAGAVGALVAFRVIYFFVPLAIGLPLFLISEAYFRVRKPAGRKNQPNSRPVVAPS